MIKDILALITKDFGEEVKLVIADAYGYTPEMELSVDDFIEEEVLKEVYQSFSQHAANSQLRVHMKSIEADVETKFETGKSELAMKIKGQKVK